MPSSELPRFRKPHAPRSSIIWTASSNNAIWTKISKQAKTERLESIFLKGNQSPKSAKNKHFTFSFNSFHIDKRLEGFVDKGNGKGVKERWNRSEGMNRDVL
jgi:hypothetical protein